MKAKLRGNVGTQDMKVIPPNPGDNGGIILDVIGGDRYCVAFGGSAGGSETRDTALRWKIQKAGAQPGCPSAVSTTTTTTLPPTCSDAEACPAYANGGMAGPCNTCCGAVASCNSACNGALASACTTPAQNDLCAVEIEAAGCSDECCP